MPGMYQPGDYDLAGFVVGVVEREHLVDGSDIAVGHRLIGLASSGLHANGYSLVRKILFERHNYDVLDDIPLVGGILGDELLKPTRIYVETVLNLLRDFSISGICHITGGGLSGNLPRILPRSCQAVINLAAWPRPPSSSSSRNWETSLCPKCSAPSTTASAWCWPFPPEQETDVLLRLQGLKEEAFVIGDIVERKNDAPAVVFV
jgi:phosphoribosylformylglycinamidine cyclo-ligase